MPRPANAVVKSADRVLDLFELLGAWSRGLSHSEIVDRLGIPKGSLTPLLRNLVERDFIEYDHVTKRYRLGHKFTQLARRAGVEQSMLDVLHPILVSLSKRTGESAMLTRLVGDEAETVDAVTGPHRLVSHMRIGDRGPLYALSGGKAILAHLPDQMRAAYLKSVTFEAIAPNTINDAAELERQLNQVRATGLAYSIEEFTIGVAGIGAAIISDDGFPVGGITVTMPRTRFTAEAQHTAIEHLKLAVREAQIGLRQLAPVDGQSI